MATTVSGGRPAGPRCRPDRRGGRPHPQSFRSPFPFAVFVRAVNCRAEEACVITQGTRVEQSSATRPASSTPA